MICACGYVMRLRPISRLWVCSTGLCDGRVEAEDADSYTAPAPEFYARWRLRLLGEDNT